MTKIEKINEEAFILPGAKALVTVNSPADDAAKEKDVPPKDTSSRDWSDWGDDNFFPQNVLTDLEKNSIALRALEKRKNVHYGRGIIPYRELDEEDTKTGEKKREIVQDKNVKEFFRLNRVNIAWLDLIGSLEIFANGWPEFILNKNRDKINRVFIKDPAYCRLGKMDEKARIRNLFYSAQWDHSPDEEGGTLLRIPMYDPEKYDGKKYADPKFIYPVFYKSFNKSYYHLSVWNGVRKGGWMDIANKVPTLKLALMKNQMTIKYHIEIPHDYFSKRFPSPDFTKEQREAKITEKIEELNDFLTDVENSGKSFVSFVFFDTITKQNFPGWKFNVIDNKLKDDAYLPDSQAANSEILFAIGVDPCLIGSGIPGGKLGAGSGSDKREAFWMLNAEMGPYRSISLEPLYFIRDFNKWDPTIQFDYLVVDTSQTQDKHPTKKEKQIDQNAEQ